MKKILNFDSLYSTYINENGILSPYSCSFPLAIPIRNLKRLQLNSIEIPLLFNNIRYSSNNLLSLNYLSFNYVFNSVTYTYSGNIPENYYNSITTLINVINTQLITYFTSVSRVCSVTFNSNSYNQVTITSTNCVVTLNNSTTVSNNNLRLSYPFMNEILGFNGVNETNFTSGSTLTASSRYNLNVDNYLNMNLYNITASTQNANNLYCSFKIPLNASNGVMYYSFINSTYSQHIDNTDNNYILDKLLVKMSDRWGNTINANGADYSFTLEIEYN